MLTLTIDGQPVQAHAGETILQAATRLGIAIPTLCHVPGLEPSGSCFVCVVAVEGMRKLVPACAFPVADGMKVTTNSPDIQVSRRAALELLLSDHLGECQAPCELACPARWDIPGFMEALRDGHADAAGRIARAGLVLPAILGHVCAAPCQKACRRTERGEGVAIRALHRHAAALDAPRPPGVGPLQGRRVAVVGAGPAGLAAAEGLRRAGADVTVFDAADAPGGSLRDVDADTLPPAVRDAEIAALAAAGIRFTCGFAIGAAHPLPALRAEHDAVVLAIGEAAVADPVVAATLAEAGVALAGGRLQADAQSRATSAEGIFAAGACAGRGTLAVRAVADGLAAAQGVAQFLAGLPVTGPVRRSLVRYGPLEDEEQAVLWARVTNDAPAAGAVVDDAAAAAESGRCLICGCHDNDRCRLRQLATELSAKTGPHHGERRRLWRDDSHPAVRYEPHKCILCGACVEIVRQAGVRPGLMIVGRGFAARVAAPYEAPWGEVLPEDVALHCADACPTSAITRRRTGP